MKKRVTKTTDGREIVEWKPENEEDLEFLRQMDELGALDTKASFADDPEAAKKEIEDE